MQGGKMILALSDSHGNREMVKRVVEKCPFVDMIFHLGDTASDAVYIQTLTNKPVYYVRGNCDFSSLGEEWEEVRVLGRNFLLTHGHTCGVKYSLNRLFYTAEEKGCEAVLYGHTHISRVDVQNGIMMINPGCLSHTRTGKYTYALINVTQHGITPKIVSI